LIAQGKFCKAIDAVQKSMLFNLLNGKSQLKEILMHSLLSLIVGIVFCILLFSGCANVQQDWESAKEQNTLSAYQSFLEKRPRSEYDNKARTTIDTIGWNKAQEEDSIDGYERYISANKRGDHVKEARTRLKEVKEDLVWEQVFKTGTEYAFKTFVRKYPKSKHVPKAEKWLALLAWNEAVKKDSLFAYKSYLSKYPKSKWAELAQDKIANLSQHIIRSSITYIDVQFSTDEQTILNVGPVIIDLKGESVDSNRLYEIIIKERTITIKPSEGHSYVICTLDLNPVEDFATEVRLLTDDQKPTAFYEWLYSGDYNVYHNAMIKNGIMIHSGSVNNSKLDQYG